MVKIIKRKIASKTSENNQLPSQENELPSQEDLLSPQQNSWKTYSTVYDEIREDCRLDYLQDLGNVHCQHPDGDLLCEVDDITEDYLDYLLGFE